MSPGFTYAEGVSTSTCHSVGLPAR
jgi:hypothetical protein